MDYRVTIVKGVSIALERTLSGVANNRGVGERLGVSGDHFVLSVQGWFTGVAGSRCDDRVLPLEPFSPEEDPVLTPGLRGHQGFWFPFQVLGFGV